MTSDDGDTRPGRAEEDTGIADSEAAWRHAAERLAQLPPGEIPAAVAAMPDGDLIQVRDILGFDFPGFGIVLGPHAGIAYECCTSRLGANS